jgi:ligand-binding sensor domain-containing protein
MATFTTGQVLTAAQMNSIANLTLRTVTATSDTLVLTDADNKLIVYSTTGTVTITVPPNSSVAMTTGSVVNIIKTGATGTLSITQGSGVTIASAGATSTNPVITGQYKAASLLKVASDTWYVVGGIA